MTPDAAFPYRRALVTGASSGIGAAYARALAARGCDLVLVARSRDRLAAVAADLAKDFGVEVETEVADLGDGAARGAVSDRLAAEPAIDFLVNNAGSGWYGRFDQIEAETIREIVEVGVNAVTELSRAVLPGMVELGRGAVVNLSSLLAFTSSVPSPPLPQRASYTASKAFALSLSLLLADELRDTGVKVQALCPGIVDTEFHERAGVDPDAPPPFEPMTADEVVAASLLGLTSGEVVCAPGLHDLDILEARHAADRDCFFAAAPGPLADRYRS
ncbi:MAG TPA: SDR family NAD(P)-dependent oxidoreductase [Solirubrobacterales bacterium]|jgi:hypothetical protein